MTGDEHGDRGGQPPGGTDELERRYRRLLAWYPWEHRRTYEDEMLGALLAGARPGQRWPEPGDVVNLGWAAVRARLGLTLRQVGDRNWADAAAVFGLLGALLLLGWQVLAIASPALRMWSFPMPRETSWVADPTHWLRTGLWALVIVAVLTGVRRLAASLGWVAALTHVVLLGVAYDTEPVPVVHALWPALFGTVCAAALTVPAPPRRAVHLLGRRRFLSVAGCAGLMLVAGAWRVIGTYRGLGPAPGLDRLPLPSGPALLFCLAFVAAVLAVLRGVPAPVRRRGLVLLAPVVAVYLVVRLGLSGWVYSNGHLGHPVYLAPVQWAILAVSPLLAFGLGLVALRWREQTLRLVALGRHVDRHPPDPTR